MHLFTTVFLVGAAIYGRASPACVADQVRISLTNASDGSAMGVSWATSNETTPAAYVGIVAYGPSPSSLTFRSGPSDSRNYTMLKVLSPFLHYTILTELKPRATVFYQILAVDGCGGSPVLNFTASPPTGASSYPISVVGYVSRWRIDIPD